MMRRAALVAVAILAMGISPSLAGSVFLSNSYYEPQLLLPPPPADGSPVQRAEMDELHHIEQTRTQARFARAMKDEETESVLAFADVMGPGFDLDHLPKTKQLFDDVRAEEKAAGKRAKDYFKRNRPWIADPKIKACATDDDPQSSYPSGHATMGYAMAVVLARLAPEKAQAIMARAEDYAENRLVCSMHYRRDIVAGEVLGTAVAAEMMTVQGFRDEFDAARAELVAAHVIAP
jgi:acid phosphatase (class A)